MFSPHNRSRPVKGGFTLIETILAIGIVAFAMLPILGLVPVGLNNLREAISFTAESQIIQSLSNDILLTDYDLVVARYGGGADVHYYDDEGGQLLGPDAPGRVYTARVTLKDVSAPADASVAPATSKCAIIELTNLKFPQNGKKYSLIVPKA